MIAFLLCICLIYLSVGVSSSSDVAADDIRVIGNRLIETEDYVFVRMANMVNPIEHVNVTHTPEDAPRPTVEARVVMQQLGITAGTEDTEAARTLMHTLMVTNPVNHIAVIPPPNGCTSLSQASYTARIRRCRYVLAGGFVDPEENRCESTVLSHGMYANRREDLTRLHFGVTDDGYFFLGRLSKLSANLPDGKRVWRSEHGHERTSVTPVIVDGIPGITEIPADGVTRDTIFTGNDAKQQLERIRRRSWRFLHLLAGGRELIRSGRVLCAGPYTCPGAASPFANPAELVSRAAVGITSDGRLLLASVDGHNEPSLLARAGASSWTLASALHAMGAYHALELQAHAAGLIANYTVLSAPEAHASCPNGMDLSENNRADTLSRSEFSEIWDYYTRIPLLSPPGTLHNTSGIHATPTCAAPAAAVLCVYDGDDIPERAHTAGWAAFARDHRANALITAGLASLILLMGGAVSLLARARKRLILARVWNIQGGETDSEPVHMPVETIEYQYGILE